MRSLQGTCRVLNPVSLASTAVLRAFERQLGAALLEHPGGRCVTLGYLVGLGVTLQLARCCAAFIFSACWALRS